MCSAYEEGDLKPIESPNCRSELSRKCMKCKEALAKIVIRVNDPFCQDCFIQYTTHKFRSAFGKSKIIRDGEKVLLAFSGGASSTAMLHLVKEGKSTRAQKKLRFNPGLIYIDEGAVLELTDSERISAREKISELMNESGYPVHIAFLEQALDMQHAIQGESAVGEDRLTSSLHQNCSLSEDKPKHEGAEKRLVDMFAMMKSLTAKEQLIRTLRNRLLIDMARREGYDKVIVGDTATRLSVTILSNIAQGKGAHIPFDTSLLDDRLDDLVIVRPLREFTNKEIALYNMFNNLQTVLLPAITTKGFPSASIDKLTESFVNGLQADFPSTVNTIMRTGDKLSNTEQLEGVVNSESTECCALCQATLDTKIGTASAIKSARCSDALVHKKLVDNEKLALSASIIREGHAELMEACCYSCQQTLQDMTDSSKLPEFVLEEAARRANRKKLRESIEDCLL